MFMRLNRNTSFVIHGAHDILALCYAKCPNKYLPAIDDSSAKFRGYSNTKHIYCIEQGDFICGQLEITC